MGKMSDSRLGSAARSSGLRSNDVAKRGFYFPVSKQSSPLILGDGFEMLYAPLSESRRPAAQRVHEEHTSRSAATPADVLAESAWLWKNRKVWGRYMPTKSLAKLPSAPNVGTPFDGLTLDEVLAMNEFPDPHGPNPTPHSPDSTERGATALLVAWWMRFGEEPVDLDSPEVRAFVRSAWQQPGARSPPNDLEVASTLLASGASLPVMLVVFCARSLMQAGMFERAAEVLVTTEEPDALVLAADAAKALGREDVAIAKVAGALARGIDTLGAVERMDRWRHATFGRAPRPTIAVVVNGIPWKVCFQPRPILGRADADVLVSAPLVSRRQIELFLIDGIPHLCDACSTHGTQVDGVALQGMRPILDAPVVVVIGGSIRCTARRADVREGDGVVVETPGGQHLLSFGPRARVGDWSFVRSHGKLMVSHASSQIRQDEGGWCAEAEANVGATFDAQGGGSLIVEIESFYG